ncbi:hypothetical protein L1987_37219 [Smallanthus sonchifolius]|uniref:Uncharacterized protein n=1 Tax=Smallanthus sonchifolius TaxID=185202 RepID=A0ACB9HFQ5_9ASTR|nr:hypothetical protein L1987_37219 [Smallanthus sonchifolius]
MFIFINRPEGLILPIGVKPPDTIGNVKVRLCGRMLVLMLNGTVLKDSGTLLTSTSSTDLPSHSLINQREGGKESSIKHQHEHSTTQPDFDVADGVIGFYINRQNKSF